MWLARELARLLARIVLAVAIASVIAAVKAAASGGGMVHTWKISLLALGCLMFLLAAAGRGAARRRVNQAMDIGPTYVMRIPGMQPPSPDDPRLTESAAFVGSGVVLVVLGILA
jgi:hypothetical protein